MRNISIVGVAAKPNSTQNRFYYRRMTPENCADILRGSLDPADYRQPVMT
jgi:hypothetical protein